MVATHLLRYSICMSATTVKLEEELLREIRILKPQGQSLAAFVREAVERDILRRKLRSAAERYQAFLGENPEEGQDLDDWERARLTTQPRRTRR
jgi:hypothetical protein